MIKSLKRLAPHSLKTAIYNNILVTPPLYKKTKIGNALGLQTARSLLLNLSFYELFHRNERAIQHLQKYITDLDTDGCVIIKNFLTDTVYEEVRKEYYELAQFFRLLSNKRPKRNKLRLLGSTQLKLPDNFPKTIEKAFLQNDDIKRIVEKVGRAPLNLLPSVGMYQDWYDESDLGKDPDADTTHHLHADVTYPSLKMFYYIEDVDDDQGPLAFVKGSHRLSFKRLIADHKLSNRYSQKGYYDDEGFLTENQRKIYPSREVKLSAPANSLIIFNAMGFHRRGDFKSTKPRCTLQFGYRSQKSKLNRLCKSENIKRYFVNGSQRPNLIGE